MNKLLSILKATVTEDFNRTKFRKKKSKNIFAFILKMFLVFFIVSSILGSVAMYAYVLGEKLVPVGLTYVMLGIFSLVTIIAIFMEGMYRAGSVLFDSKDNDMLLSMPIKKSTIVASRLIRFIAFEYIWTLVIMVPTVAVYEYLAKTDIYFYISTIVFALVIPIIPIIIASIFGYFTKLISSRFKKKNIIQIFLMLVLTVGIMQISFFFQTYLTKIAENAKSINDMISKIYYPLGLYIDSVIKFDSIKLLILFFGNILIVIVFVYLFSLGYYKTISKLSENYSNSKYKLNKKEKIKSSGATYALFKKELKRYISSPMYFFNTAFGAIMILLAGGYLIIKNPTTLVLEGQNLTFLLKYIPQGLMLFFAFTFGVSCTTAASISLEGKSFWLIKSMPVKEIKIFISKILVNLLILLPAGYLVIIATSIRFGFSGFEILMLFISSTVMALFISITGLFINLMFPRLNFKSDVEIVKQSASVMITILAGLIPVIVISIVLAKFHITNINMFTVIATAGILVITAAMYIILNTYGVKKFRELN